jgi:hypothetical protein
MVRRDEEKSEPRRGEALPSCCASPTGASPVPAGVRAPGSRPQPSGGEPDGRAGRQKGLRTEQARGPQHEVKPAASAEKQSGTSHSRCHADLRAVVAQLNPVLRGWGGYFRTCGGRPHCREPAGNAAAKFNQLDSYVWRRLMALRVKRAGSKLRPAAVERWTSDYFVQGFGLHRLRGTVRYPEAA